MKTSKRLDSIIAGIVLVFAIFMFDGCSVRADVLDYQKDKQVMEAKNDSFIMLVKLTDIILMDNNTGVLYVREKHASYGGFETYTTFPIMEADGTCLTYDEWKARGSK